MLLKKIRTGTPGEIMNRSVICGMEIHAELKTESKMFCSCKNDPFHAPQPNLYTCPVCLGMPGGLPVANKKAIEWTIRLGLALHCKINLFSHFDRKHYFYPDLPKGYQISQYDQPFCYDGTLETPQGTVRIRRIHLEEDTGKLLHKTIDNKKVSLIDFNRSSVPLVEIVTEPDIFSPEQAKSYAKNIRQILRYLDIADCDMEQGGMRLEANISVSPDTKVLPEYKVEVKNINSFRFLEKAIAYETLRQNEVLDGGKIPAQETRGWSEAKGKTFAQRTKEDAEDYRYFPDPDLPPMRFTEKEIAEIQAMIPELPNAILERWEKSYGIEKKSAELLFESQQEATWLEKLFVEAKKAGIDGNTLSKALANKKIAFSINENSETVLLNYKKNTQSDTIDSDALESAVSAVLVENEDAVVQYKSGKVQVIGFFIGQVSRNLGKKVDSQILTAILKKELEK